MPLLFRVAELRAPTRRVPCVAEATTAMLVSNLQQQCSTELLAAAEAVGAEPSISSSSNSNMVCKCNRRVSCLDACTA